MLSFPLKPACILNSLSTSNYNKNAVYGTLNLIAFFTHSGTPLSGFTTPRKSFSTYKYGVFSFFPFLDCVGYFILLTHLTNIDNKNSLLLGQLCLSSQKSLNLSICVQNMYMISHRVLWMFSVVISVKFTELCMKNAFN